MFLPAAPGLVRLVPAQEGSRVFWTQNHVYRMLNGQIAKTWPELSFHHLLAQITGKV
jgi:predicted ester cyclase